MCVLFLWIRERGRNLIFIFCDLSLQLLEPGLMLLEAELLAWSEERMAKYKCPRAFTFVVEMPRDPNGKLAKRKLRDPYWADLGRQI